MQDALRFFVASIFLLISSTAFATDIFTTRGIIYEPGYRAQENTLDAFLAIDAWNKNHPETFLKGSEMHVVVVKPKNPGDAPIFVCTHDENLKDLTGKDINIHDLSRTEIQNLDILQVLYNIDYGKTRKFMFFEQALDTFMKGTPPFMIWLGVKDRDYRPKPGEMSYTAVELIKALKNWHDQYLKERNVDIFKYIIISCTNPFIVNELDKQSKALGLDKLGLNIFPDYMESGVPKCVWDAFFAVGGYEKVFDLESNWVSIEKALLSQALIDKYHAQGKKILAFSLSPDDPLYNKVEVELASH